MESNKNSLLAALSLLARDFLFGMGRLSAARITANELRIAVYGALEEHANIAESDGSGAGNLFSGLLSLRPSEVDAFRYVTNTSHLIYATTLLDAFIHECTIFLHLLHPASMGPDHPLVLEDVLAVGSRDEIITRLASKKARDVSYRGFKDRLRYLRKTFGLKVSLGKDTLQEIGHFAGIRNVVVHSQSAHELAFDAERGVIATPSSCPIHPRPIGDDVFRKANRAYLSLAAEVFSAIVDQVLCVTDEESAREILELFVHQLKITYPYNVPKHARDPQTLELAREEIEDNRLLGAIGERARKLAREAFKQSLQEASSQAQQGHTEDG